MARTWIVLALLLPLAAHAEQWNFDVYLDGKQIGTHRFSVEREGAETYRVTSLAEFKVSVLFVPVFRYHHAAVETWRDGCLQSIDTQTQENGKRTELTGRLTPAGFDVDVSTSDGRRREQLPQCVQSYAYWNRDILSTDGSLLNSQTGAYEPVARSIVREPEQTLLELKGADFKIDLTYANGDARWVSLQTLTKDGRDLEYRLEPTTLASRS